MFRIEFYSAADGTSELWDFLDNLQKKIMFFSINFVRKRRKHLGAKSKRQKQNATIGLSERGDLYGNLV